MTKFAQHHLNILNGRATSPVIILFSSIEKLSLLKCTTDILISNLLKVHIFDNMHNISKYKIDHVIRYNLYYLYKYKEYFYD